ncbi:MAG: filamentous hemagglutinin N-terminal domain-containing protein [Gammaproteobacteria bacterium]|nr:filamentous hemagglutinin N-terminal domain-containing protein [Gammaproteobacteria bacterium]
MKVDQHHLYARRTQVPAPTLRARFQPRTPDGRAIRPRLLISAIACLLPAATLAGPKDGQVVVGQSSISTPDANTTIIRQTTDKSVINWQSFSVGTKEYVKFVQPQTSSISLNRVVGGNPSSILGSLSANGQVYLVNPNGIYFGEGARVDVSGIVASVLDISNTDFMSGNFVFEGSADENLGKVINDGIINARNEGYVVLMGDYSENNGVIQAQMGKVVLASGSRVTMDISGNSLISVAVNEAALSDLAGVKNSGEIYADGGRVIMTARVADNLIGSAVNNEGLIRANSIVEKDGAIFLTAIGGDVTNSGTLDASAAADSNVDGGGVLVYSDRDITLSSGAAIHARGDGDGAGGVVRVIAEDVLDHQQGAGISVAGSPHAGGFVEVSGHGGLRLRGQVDVGSGGTLLIDPSTFTINVGAGSPNGTAIASVGSTFLVGQLTAGNDVFLVASDSINASAPMTITANGAGDGDLNLVIGTVSSGGGSLGGPGSSYQCNSAGFCLGGSVGSGNFNVNPDPTGDILLGNVKFNLDGRLNVAAGTMAGSVSLGDVLNAASLNVAGGSTAGTVTLASVNVGGNVSITAGDNINFQGHVRSAGGGLTATAGQDIFVNNAIGGGSATGGVPFNGPVNLNADGSIAIDADILVASDDINLKADVDGNGSGDVNINGLGSCTDGCFGEPRTVLTTGDLNVTGQNFNVNGADFGTSGISTDQNVPVNVKANRVIVNIAGDMNVKGGRVNLDVALGSSGAGGTSKSIDTSVKVTGTSLVDITANNLTVQGGSAAASVSGTFYASSVKAFANAEVAATGGNMTVTLGGSLNVNAGNANAANFEKTLSDFVVAEANASLSASGAVTIVAPGGVSVLGGSALADAQGLASFSEGPKAEANATLDAGANLGITVANGNLLIQGGTATAAVTFSSGSFMSASANANAKVASGGTTTVALTNGGLSVLAGTATAEASASNSNDASAFANANADLQVSGNLDVTSVGTDIAIGGGAAIARIPGNGSSSTCSSCNVGAHANAGVQANNVTIANVGGNFDLSAGFANAGISVNTYIESSAQMHANADASLSADSVAITVTGTLTVAGGLALAGGSWTNGTVGIQAHADALLEAVSSDVNLTANAVNVSGGFAAIGGASSVSGDDATIGATAKADVGANRDVTIVASSGLSVSGGDANVSFVTAFGTISADANASAKIHAGRDMGLTVAGGGINVQGGSAVAIARGNGRPRHARPDAWANASLTANGNLGVNSAGTNVTVAGGSAGANAHGSCSDCDASAKADGWISGGVVTLNNIGGDLNVQGGNANASGVGTICDTCSMVADANAEVTGGSVSVNSLAGSLNVTGGNALARPEDEMAPGFASANAFAKISASNNISIDAGNSVNVFAEQATVTGFWGSANTMNARANADAVIDAGGNLNVTAVAGLNIFGGTASANPNTTGGTNGTASASAKAELKAGGNATINVTSGSVMLVGGSSNPGNTTGGTSYSSSGRAARASGSSGTTPLRKAFANASVKAGLLQVMAATDVYGSSADIDAQGIYIAAGNDLHLYNTTTTVGNGVAPGVSGDPLVLNIMEAAGIPLPANSDPNLKFQAGGTMHTGDIEATASNAYLWFETDEVLSVSNISAPVGPLTVQYSPFTPTLGIVFEDQSPSLDPDPPPQDILPRGRLAQARPLEVYYDNASLISPFPMTTVVLGSAKQSGPMTVGANGPIDIVARNILLLTIPDNVNSPDNVITTGIVATSGFVASLGRDVFISPRLDSFEVETETVWDQEEERKRQLVETPEEDHGMCTAL